MDIRLEAYGALEQRGDVPRPDAGNDWLAIFPPAGFDGYGDKGTVLSAWHQAGAAKGAFVKWPEFGALQPMPYVIAFPEKDQIAARAQVAAALRYVTTDGLVVLVAENEAGGKRLGATLEGLGITQFHDHAKHHCRVVVVHMVGQKPDTVAIEAAIAAGTTPRLAKHGYYTLPGLHSDAAVDAGSALLVQHLPDDIRGIGADFGCGWGYITLEALKKCPKIQQLHVVDADARALLCLQQNVQHLCPDQAGIITPHWADLTAPVDGVRGLDFILMNPPFHTGKQTIPALGLAMIARAAASLKSGRRLILVANRHLPYEIALKELFGRVDALAIGNGFKVYSATKA